MFVQTEYSCLSTYLLLTEKWWINSQSAEVVVSHFKVKFAQDPAIAAKRHGSSIQAQVAYLDAGIIKEAFESNTWFPVWYIMLTPLGVSVEPVSGLVIRRLTWYHLRIQPIMTRTNVIMYPILLCPSTKARINHDDFACWVVRANTQIFRWYPWSRSLRFLSTGLELPAFPSLRICCDCFAPWYDWHTHVI